MIYTEKYYEGIVHAHTTRSFDGQLSYPELKDFLQKQGLSFICVTEHIEGLDQAQIDTIIDECRTNSDDNFLFIPGIEMDCFFICFLGISHVIVDFSDNRAVFHSLSKSARMCIFSHPIKARYKYPQWLIDQCDGVEVLNTKHDGEHYLRPQSEKLFREISKTRPQIVAVAGMDFHNRKNYTPIRLRLQQAGPLTTEFVLDALRQNHFFIVKNNRDLRSYGFARRTLAKLRIHAMDLSHKIHLILHDAGIVVPPRVKSMLRRLMEGH